jgi:alpha-D-ribose 1-methylphosphonate 5-triphosphate synthase subunit PhnH
LAKAPTEIPNVAAFGSGAPIKPGPGFNDYPMDSQAVFRLALEAMSKPAQAIPFDFGALFKTAPPLPRAVAALALTLADHLTPVWLSPSFAATENFMVFHTSAPIVRDPEKAALVLAASQSELPPLSLLSQGDPRYPDRSATIVLAGVLDDPSPGLSLLASGPGLAEEIIFEGHGLTEAFVDQWALNRASYPLGLDVILAGNASLAGLPRSLALKPKDGRA